MILALSKIKTGNSLLLSVLESHLDIVEPRYFEPAQGKKKIVRNSRGSK